MYFSINFMYKYFVTFSGYQNNLNHIIFFSTNIISNYISSTNFLIENTDPCSSPIFPI